MLRAMRLAVLAMVALGLTGCSTLPLPTLAPVEHHETRPVAVDETAAATWVTTYRGRHGLVAVTADPALQRVAQAQADAMAVANRLSHTVAGTLPHRLGPLAAVCHASIENVSAGYPTMAAAFDGWQRSPAHDANLLFAPMRRVGIAAANAPGTRFGTYWCLIMTD